MAGTWQSGSAAILVGNCDRRDTTIKRNKPSKEHKEPAILETLHHEWLVVVVGKQAHYPGPHLPLNSIP